MDTKNLVKVNDFLWEIPKSYRNDMRVPARVFASKDMIKEISKDRSLEQLINVATLPGIINYALAMPDIHEGYGFPIGGVAAFNIDKGIISPGGVGYDINCGVRLLRSKKTFDEVKDHIEILANKLYKEIPSGVGRGGRFKLNVHELDKVLEGGAKYIVERGFGKKEDLEHIESNGELKEANPEFVPIRAKKRGSDQLGTMGAGNHFVEVDVVEEIFNKDKASELNLFKNQICIQIHTGSRGLGHQVATDYIRKIMGVMPKYKIFLRDKELACAPFSSREGQGYFYAMCAGANFAWANRQLITYEARKVWGKVFGKNESLEIVYDVAHNIAKIEEFKINGKLQKLIIHRKGATKSYPNQPVLIPGSMGTKSYVLIGREKSLKESFGSTCHGAGRRMSRTKARKEFNPQSLRYELKNKGITINVGSIRGLIEEAPEAYKNVDNVVNVIENAGIAEKVVSLRPIAVIKG